MTNGRPSMSSFPQSTEESVPAVADTPAPPAPPILAGLPTVRPSGGRRPRRIGRSIGIFLALLLVAGVVVVVGTPSLNGRVKALFASSNQEIVTYHVRKGTLEVTINEKGNLESAENKDVHNQVEGSTTIIFILPEGSP